MSRYSSKSLVADMVHQTTAIPPSMCPTWPVRSLTMPKAAKPMTGSRQYPRTLEWSRNEVRIHSRKGGSGVGLH